MSNSLDYQVIVTYDASYRTSVLSLFSLLVPTYFAADELMDLATYLDTDSAHYFLCFHQGQLIGAGGVNFGFDEGSTARISWDAVHPNYQGQGIGRVLLKHRMAYIQQHVSVDKVVVRTSQMAYGFYERMGFILQEISPNFWAPGYDLYLMEQSLGIDTRHKS